MDIFRVRLNCVDHYQAIPTDLDPRVPRESVYNPRNSAPRVPVLRVFGATETGQKVCAHIHGAFPYLYIPYSQESLSPSQVNIHIRQLHLSINHALAVSYRKNIYDQKAEYVAHISLVKGVPFYGYHVGFRYFLKIYILNPLHMTRLADLLRQGAIMRCIIQPYESHMQYILQWMIDFNLYGCGYLECSSVRFRRPVPDYLDIGSAAHKWHDRSVATDQISDETMFPRQSHCTLEVDIHVADIINRRDVEARSIHEQVFEHVNETSIEEKLVQSMAGLWRDETKRRKLRMGLLEPGSSPFPPDVLVSVSADVRNDQDGDWIHEAEYRKKIQDIIQAEKVSHSKQAVHPQAFSCDAPSGLHIRTAIESVEDLFPYVQNENAAVDLGRDPNLMREDNQHQAHDDLGSTNGHNDQMTVSRGGSAKEQQMIARPQTGTNMPIGAFPQGMTEEVDRGDQDETKQSAHRQEILNSEDLDPGNPISQSDNIVDRIAQEKQSPKIRKLRFDLPDDEDALNDRESNHPFGPDMSDSSPERTPKKLRLMDLASEAQRSSGLVDGDQGRNRENKNDISRRSFLFTALPSVAEQTQRVKNRQSSCDRNTSLCEPLQRKEEDCTSPVTDATISDKPYSNSFERSQNETTGGKHGQCYEHAVRFHDSFDSGIGQVLHWSTAAPNLSSLKMDFEPDLHQIYQEPYYQNEDDVPDLSREYAGREFKLESLTVPFLPDFDAIGESLASFGQKQAIALDRASEELGYSRRRAACSLMTWEYELAPPRSSEVCQWVSEQDQNLDYPALPDNIRTAKSSQIDHATQLQDPIGSRGEGDHRTTSVRHETQYMSLMSLEIHVNVRQDRLPDPAQDEVATVFWALQSEDEDLHVNGMNEGTHVGILVLSDGQDLGTKICQCTTAEVEELDTELDLINRLIDIVRSYDPDILTGFEVHDSSWGYLIERARRKYDYNLCDELSRMKSQSHGRFGKEDDRWGFNHTSTIRVTGRHIINIWRAMRGELNLLQYTMENVVQKICNRRIPHFAFPDLTAWYRSGQQRDLMKVIEYYVSRVQLDLEILELNELVPRTSEQARLLGVDFYSVFSRGSQFKVESLMFRIAKPENFILPSPSRKQVGGQNALECLPLVMEPQSAFYNSPLLVLDFQSLYPSVMIAYNYCYSTFLGRVVDWRGHNKMGFSDYARRPRLLELLEHDINIAPNGMIYAKPRVRKSLLAKMLGEILETRVMVKSGMKVDKDDQILQRLLNNRQLALKLIANVTYGYTSASFSGRMPCSEIADSIVQTGRETLEKAIALIHSVDRWQAEVVYGDTDSLFVYLKGRSREEAFKIGNEIAKAVTNMNPRPIKLKFEKVYHPCVLLAKKRYVGYKYEHEKQTVPEFDAKGIETVRRDGTPAEQKIEERALKILFRSADLSQVKSYFQAQCQKIMQGKVSIQDFCFAKEVKLGTYSEKGPPPPGALISTRKMIEDPRAEPQYGERVPYVVIAGAPGARLIDRCVAPDQLLNDVHNELDCDYYISKNIIPPLERIFNLVGANVRQWYDEMPKIQRIRRIEMQNLTIDATDNAGVRKTLESYMQSSLCIVCRTKLEEGGNMCFKCLKQSGKSMYTLRMRIHKSEQKAAQLDSVCRSCAGIPWGDQVKCDSKDCPVFYTRTRHAANLKNVQAVSNVGIKTIEASTSDLVNW